MDKPSFATFWKSLCSGGGDLSVVGGSKLEVEWSEGKRSCVRKGKQGEEVKVRERENVCVTAGAV